MAEPTQESNEELAVKTIHIYLNGGGVVVADVVSWKYKRTAAATSFDWEWNDKCSRVLKTIPAGDISAIVEVRDV